MSGDGASLGVMPERALETVLGGADQPNEEEKLSPKEFEDQIREAPIEANSYNGAAAATARIIVEAIDKYPELRTVPMESVYLKDQTGHMIFEPQAVKLVLGMYDVLKQLYPDEESPEGKVLSDLTGFMWGWAYNAAARILGLKDQPNPAIVEIG